MLNDSRITSLLPTVNPKQSKAFYLNTLGLKLTSEDDYGMEFESASSSVRITVVHEFKPQPFAVLGFKVDAIDREVEALSSKNVKFERYDGLDQDDSGIWTSPSQARIAWFKDPDGNLLSLTQYSS